MGRVVLTITPPTSPVPPPHSLSCAPCGASLPTRRIGDELFVHSRLPREIRLGGCRTDHEFPTGTDCPRQPCHRARRSRRGGRSATISRRLRNRTDRHHQGEPPGTG